MDQILRANRNRRVPAWVHDLALTGDSRWWAGRVDCPTHIAQELLAREVAYVREENHWSVGEQNIGIATMLVARGDIDVAKLCESTDDEKRLAVLNAVLNREPLTDLLTPGEDQWSRREYGRYAKHLSELHVKGRVAMTNAEWMLKRRWQCDVLVSRLAQNAVALGSGSRLLLSLREISGYSEIAQHDLGYLCRHETPHGVENSECLFAALGKYDAAAMLLHASEWVVGWLDALDDASRHIALAVLASSGRGTSLEEATLAAQCIAE
jgi:hypothetical protein